MPSATTASQAYRNPPGALHAILLAGTVPLFLGALLSDIAYYQTYHIQWADFASWLIIGGLLFCGLALVFALVNLFSARTRAGHSLVYFLLLLAAWVLGLVNAFQHAKDAWAVMPAGLLLSLLVTVLVCFAAWIGLRARSGASS
jgi:uncharacterized membrane protein